MMDWWNYVNINSLYTFDSFGHFKFSLCPNCSMIQRLCKIWVSPSLQWPALSSTSGIWYFNIKTFWQSRTLHGHFGLGRLQVLCWPAIGQAGPDPGLWLVEGGHTSLGWLQFLLHSLSHIGDLKQILVVFLSQFLKRFLWRKMLAV